MASETTDLSEGIKRQRRNMLGLALIIIVYQTTGTKIDSINLGFFRFENTDETALLSWMLAALVYFTVRYSQYYSSDSNAKASHSELWSRINSSTIDSISSLVREKLDAKWKDDVGIELLNSAFRKKQGSFVPQNSKKYQLKGFLRKKIYVEVRHNRECGVIFVESDNNSLMSPRMANNDSDEKAAEHIDFLEDARNLGESWELKRKTWSQNTPNLANVRLCHSLLWPTFKIYKNRIFGYTSYIVKTRLFSDYQLPLILSGLALYSLSLELLLRHL